MRRDRVPHDMRVLGRMVPIQPAVVQESHAAWTSMHRLDVAIAVALNVVQQHLGEPAPLELTYGHYPEVSRLPFGCTRRELLVPGCYIITDTSPWQRILYAGSSCDGTVRQRLISHLYSEGRLYHAQRAFRSLMALWQSQGYPDSAEADADIRRAVFGRNRWVCDALPESQDEPRQVAVRLIQEGAFDIAMVRVPPEYRAVARCIEHFVLEFVRADSGELPPLNSIPVKNESRRHRQALVGDQVGDILDAMGTLAKNLGVRARGV